MIRRREGGREGGREGRSDIFVNMCELGEQGSKMEWLDGAKK